MSTKKKPVIAPEPVGGIVGGAVAALAAFLNGLERDQVEVVGDDDTGYFARHCESHLALMPVTEENEQRAAEHGFGEND